MVVLVFVVYYYTIFYTIIVYVYIYILYIHILALDHECIIWFCLKIGDTRKHSNQLIIYWNWGGTPFSDKPIYEWDMIGCNVMDVPGRS